MIVLDTNVLIDLFGIDDHNGARWSRRIYSRFAGDAPFGCNLIVLAEVAAQGGSAETLLGNMERFQIQLLDLDLDVAMAAGKAHRSYRERGGNRQTILPDFLIAGHAAAIGAHLMTRDRRLASYFPDLTLITPETHP